MAAITSLPPVPPHQEQVSFLPSIKDDRATTSSKPYAADEAPSGPVTASLNFYKSPDDGSNPFNYVENPPAGQPQRNFGETVRDVQIQDARGQESAFNLEKHAFATLQGYPHNPTINWKDDDSIKQHYYPEVEKLLLKEVEGANRILLFDHTVRRAEKNAHRAPVTRAHIDQTPKSAAQRVAFHLPDESEQLLQGRYRIINVWRPLNGPVQSFPLAFAASDSVADADMVPVEHRYPDRTGETAGVKHSDEHQWYYWSGVDNDERILLQCYDSAKPNNRVPHSAFVDPRTTDGMKSRESIEVRALVFG